MKLLRALSAAAVLATAAVCTPAQHLGDVSISTVQATVANNATCTGSAQNFTTDGSIPSFNNIGQTSHLATATSTAASFAMEIDGIDNLGNVFRLSDSQVGIPSAAKGGLVVVAAGYMPKIRISVTCTAAATFSVSYSGSFSPQPPNIAAALLVSIDKLPFQNAPAGSNASTTFQSPTGNSSGTVIFQYAATGPSGSVLTVQCLTNAGINLSSFSFNPVTATTAQLFPVPSSSCPFLTMSYAAGGASATTYTLEYAFNPPGTTSTIGDPCASTSAAKFTQSINITSPATVTLVNPQVGKEVFPCTIVLDMNVNSSAVESVQFTAGTNAGCSASPLTLTGAMISGASTGTGPVFISTGGASQVMNLPVSDALCIVVVQVSGTVIGVQGWLTYAQQ